MSKLLNRILCTLLVLLFCMSNLIVVIGATPKISLIPNITVKVEQNKSYTLPKTVKATMSDKTVKDVPITWNKKSISTSKIGTIIVSGTVKGYSKQVVLTINVIAKVATPNAQATKTTKGKIYFTKTAYYEGELLGGKPHGKGVANWDGEIFEGEFKNGVPLRGKWIYKDGRIYEGEVNEHWEPMGDASAWSVNPKSKIKLKYDVTFDDLNSSNVKVKLNMSNLSGETIEVAESWGNGLGINSYIDTIKAYNKDGKNLKVSVSREFDYGDSGRHRFWNIELEGNKEIVVEYERTRNISHMIGTTKTYFGYIGENFAALSGSLIFITPADDLKVNPDIEVKFNVPEGAKVLVPWEKIGDTYYPNKNREFISSISKNYLNYGFGKTENTLAIKLEAIGIGDYNTYTKNIDGIEVTIGITPTIGDTESQKIVSDIQVIMSYMKNLFGPALNKKYLVLLSKRPNNQDYMQPFEATNSQGIVVDMAGLDYGNFNHILFHRWNAWEYSWMYKARDGVAPDWTTNHEIGHLVEEGFNNYYTDKSIIKNAEVLNGNKKLEMITEASVIYREYKGLKDNERIIYNHATNMQNDKFTSYRVGLIYSLYLDYEIMKATDGKKSLDDVQKIIFQRFSPYRKEMGKEDLLGILKEVSGKDFSEFYSKYINGNEFLNMDEIFMDTDSDGVPNYIEKIQGTDINSASSYNSYMKNLLVQ